MPTSPLRRSALIFLAVSSLALGIVGCGSSDDATPATPKAPTAAANDWRNVEITDVDGKTFTVADLEGTPVFVENFATWCSNCKKQLGKTQRAAAEAGKDAMFLALSVETDLKPADVAAYAKDNGFDDIRFAIMSPEMLLAMKKAFGTSALNPPSTPKIAISADGTVGKLVTGFEEPDEIAAALGRA